MPRYFSDLVSGPRIYTDTIGTELADVELIPDEVSGFQMSNAKDNLQSSDDFDSVILVRNEKNQVIYQSTLTHRVVWLADEDSDAAPVST